MIMGSAITPDWQVLLEEITTQALAACKKLEKALDSAAEPPPLHLGEALQAIANEYLNLCERINELRARERPRE
jgi:hypothetical protein